MNTNLLGEYVVIENGTIHMITNPTVEQMDKTYEGISTQEIEELKKLPVEELRQINNGKTLILKHIGIYLPEQNIFAESTVQDESVVKAKGYQSKKIKYNYLTDMVVQTDKRYTMVWE